MLTLHPAAMGEARCSTRAPERRDENRPPSENALRPTQKKQHARAKNISFRLETRFFSSSIRSARGEAVLRW
jgi:hypothetical protein